MYKSIDNHRKMMEFLEKYGKQYGRSERFLQDYKFFLRNYEKAGCTYWQIFSALDFISKDRDIYRRILNDLKEHFSLGQNILDIGCGYYPALARLIDMEQQDLDSGSITAYDDSLVTESVGNIDLHRDLFMFQDSSPYDLFVSTFSHNATDVVIEKSSVDHKPFYLLLCNCYPSNFADANRWRNYVYNNAKEELDVGAVLDQYNIKVRGEAGPDNMVLVKSYPGR